MRRFKGAWKDRHQIAARIVDMGIGKQAVMYSDGVAIYVECDDEGVAAEIKLALVIDPLEEVPVS
jgi:hypothetical protein